jgi:hypothetical protein
MDSTNSDSYTDVFTGMILRLARLDGGIRILQVEMNKNSCPLPIASRPFQDHQPIRGLENMLITAVGWPWPYHVDI